MKEQSDLVFSVVLSVCITSRK